MKTKIETPVDIQDDFAQSKEWTMSQKLKDLEESNDKALGWFKGFLFAVGLQAAVLCVVYLYVKWGRG
jgi:hypothetical protein